LNNLISHADSSAWEMDNTNRDNITPLILSRELTPVALGVLYRHPHLSYDHLRRFVRCATINQPGTSLSKARLVRHLTIRASRRKPIKHQIGWGPDSELYYTVHTALKDVCGLFTDLTSFTLRDTLVLHSADSKLLFDSLQLLRPKKARIEIRCWDLRDSPVGRQIAGVSSRNVHDRHTDQVVTPFRVGPPRVWNRVAVSETALMQTSWKDALLCGGELHLPPWWIDPPKLDEPSQAPIHPGDGPAPPPPSVGRLTGMRGGGMQPTVTELPRGGRTTLRGRPVIGQPAGSSSTNNAATVQGSSSVTPSTTFRSSQSVVEVNRGPYFVTPSVEPTSDTTSSLHGALATEPAYPMTTTDAPYVDTGTSVSNPASSRWPVNLAQRNRMDHLFDTDEAFQEYERRNISAIDLRDNMGASATVPPPQTRSDTLGPDGGRADISETTEQRVQEQGANLTSYMLAHEMRARLLKLLDQYWIPRLHSFSFVALDPLASLIVRHPRLEFWIQLPIPHIRVHLPRGVHSLAVFKGVDENASDRKRAARRLNLTPEAEEPGAATDAGDDDGRVGNDEDTERIVGGDGSGGDLVNDQTRLFEIEVNTVAEMEDERDWIARGEQLPAQACRILVGSSDWREVATGESEPRCATAPADWLRDDTFHTLGPPYRFLGSAVPVELAVPVADFFLYRPG
jgi:hypothetical protein